VSLTLSGNHRWQEAENTYLFIKFASALVLGRYITFVACPALLEKCRYWFGALAACPAPAHPLIKDSKYGLCFQNGGEKYVTVSIWAH